MLEIKDLTISISDRYLIKNLNLVLNNGDKLAIIGEEGNGKSTLLKSILGICEYAEISGNINLKGNRIGYLEQSISTDKLDKSVYEFLFIDESDYYDKINNLYKINMNNLFLYLKYKILIEEDNLSKYQTVDEGIENRIIKYINESNSYEELIQNIKTKRYTYNKISRMLLHILTNFTKEEAKNLNIDYIRLLGFTNVGKEYLSKIKKQIKLPLITGYKKNISKILDIELRITKLYSLVTNKDLIKEEYRNKPIIK